jgi:hypothetical protein
LREGLSGKDVESIRELSPCKGDLKDVIRDFLKKAPIDVATQIVITGLSFLLGVGATVSLVGSLVGRFLESVVGRWRKNRDEVIGGFVRLVNKAREVKNYLCDERLCDERFEAVFDEVAYEWGLNIEEFSDIITNIANLTKGKLLTEEDIKKTINENLERIEKELEKIKEEVKGQLADVKVFFIDDLESGLLYGNFIVKEGIPKIKTWVGTAKNELVTDLVDVGEFHKVADYVFKKLVNDRRVVLIGPRGIGKSTLATYVAWRSLLGSLGSVVLDKPMDAVIHIEKSLRPGDAAKLNNLVEATGRRFVMIYDPSPIEAYYKPETMQRARYDIKGIRETLRELMEVRNAWVVIVLPRELYDEVSKSEELRSIQDEIRSYMINVDLKNEGFLREVIKKYSKCDDVSDGLIKRVMGFDSYTLVAKYAGIWLRERKCKVEDVDKALGESAGEPKLFFAHYMWSTVLRENEDLARRVSVPLILHATFGPIPEGITYITKAVNEGGVWKLIDRNELAKSKLEDLREDDLEPIAKWLSTLHEDLIEETLQELVGLRGEEARKHYIDHGFKDFIGALDWGYKKALGEGREILGRYFGEITPGESSMEKFMKNLVKKLEQLIENEDELKEFVEYNQMLTTIYQQLWTMMKALPEETEAEFNSLLNLGMNLSVLVLTRSMSALKPLTNCWKRAALIIGHALTGHPIVPRPEDLPESLRRDVAESLGDALRECDVDYYLLVGNEMSPFIIGMGLPYTLLLAWAFIDKYNEAVAEVNRIHNIARGRGRIYDAEIFYGLGLASIIANATWLNRDVESSDADTALRIASFAIQRVASPHLIKSVLGALMPLRSKVPHRYLELLTLTSNMENLDSDFVRYVLYKLNEILDNYGDAVKEHAWSLVHVIDAYAALLRRYIGHFNVVEVGDVVGRIVDLLNVLDGFNSSLGVIAWAYALLPALRYEDVKRPMGEALRIDVVDKANGILEELSRLRGLVQELMKDEEFMSYIESRFVKVDEEAVKIVILDATSLLKHALAIYRLDNDELDEAEELFNEAAEERREIGDYRNYLVARSLALRAEAIKGSLVGEKLVNEFRQLYEEAKKQPDTILLRNILGRYLVSLALTGDNEGIRRIEESLKEQWLMRTPYREVSILTRLTLNALLSPRGELSGELKDRLFVKPGEFILALGGGYIDINSLPALRAIYGTIKPGDEKRLCDEVIDDPTIDPIIQDLIHNFCTRLVSRVIDDSEKLDQRGEGNLRQVLVNYFQRWISKGEVLDLLKRLNLDAESLKDELEGLIHEFSGKSLLELAMFSHCSEREQLRCSSAHLAYLLYALINGNEKLAKAHALYGAVTVAGKLPARLFLEAYEACCDLETKSFRLALARLFFYHV